ncbi:conserved hypothetical protein [Candida albicans WO-1]|uniref:Uncharacterized protein n=1 Tax=Candida albicans (strain WO-1) TaxID=294748 RepID=C4YGN7_CANAW|nr:conserved hypothetical protein [Candida albicans WO-1]
MRRQLDNDCESDNSLTNCSLINFLILGTVLLTYHTVKLPLMSTTATFSSSLELKRTSASTFPAKQSADISPKTNSTTFGITSIYVSLSRQMFKMYTLAPVRTATNPTPSILSETSICNIGSQKSIWYAGDSTIQSSFDSYVVIFKIDRDSPVTNVIRSTYASSDLTKISNVCKRSPCIGSYAMLEVKDLDSNMYARIIS